MPGPAAGFPCRRGSGGHGGDAVAVGAAEPTGGAGLGAGGGALPRSRHAAQPESWACALASRRYLVCHLSHESLFGD